MAHTETIQLADERYVMTSRTRMWVLVLIVAGLVLTAAGIFTHKSGAGHHEEHATSQVHDGNEHGDAAKYEAGEEPKSPAHEYDHASEVKGTAHNNIDDASHGHAPSWTARIWSNLLVNSWYFFLLSVMGTFFVAVNYIANAGWATTLKRIPEAMGAYLPVALVTLLVVAALGAHDLYHWMHEGVTEPGHPNYDKIIAGKSPFLNSGFLYGGTVVIMAIFILFQWILRKNSLREDEVGGLANYNKSFRSSAAFTFIFAFAFSILSWLLVMSVDVHWFSTIFSVYNFATGFVASLAVMTLLVIFLKAQGYLTIVTDEHLHDLGKFMFAFSIFWTYIWLAQYLLIWYANIPEETVYFIERRFTSPYSWVFYLNLVLNFGLPFLLFMTRDSKRQLSTLKLICPIVVVGHWFDFYNMVTPGVMKLEGAVGFLEIGVALIFAAAFLLVTLGSLAKIPLVGRNHPMLQESLHHHI